MKFHLAQIKNKDIVPCTEVLNDVWDHIQTILSTPKKQKADRAANFLAMEMILITCLGCLNLLFWKLVLIILFR